MTAQDTVSDYPSVLIMSRYDRQTGEAHCFADPAILKNDKDVDRRIAFFRMLEKNGGLPYTLQICHIDDAAECIAATLESLRGR